MDKFIDEEKNMLENDPEIRDPSLRVKPSLWERLLWRRWYKGSSAVLSLAVPAAVVISIATLTSCTPQVDEMQQKAYKDYLYAWDEYRDAVYTYDAVQNPEKPSLPANLVLTKDLDEKATTESLKYETDNIEEVIREIFTLCDYYRNNDSQKVAYQNYLSAWDTYANAVAEYEALENAEKPALPANLVLSKDLDEKATTKALNDVRTALENATAEINKLIKQYEQETPTPPNPDKPMTKEEIAEKVTSAVESNVKEALGGGATDIRYLAIDYKEIEDKHYVDILTEYHNPLSADGVLSIKLIRIPMQTELSEENIKNATFKPKNEWDASTIVNVPTKTADTRDKDVLAKLNPTLAETNPSFISLTNTAGDVISIGGTNEIKIFVINDNGITIIKTNARSDGNRVDPIGQSILAETAEEGTDYTKPTIETFVFGENVILLGEMFQGEQAQEYENVDAEINGVRYAIIRNHHTVYNEELDKVMKEPESY